MKSSLARASLLVLLLALVPLARADEAKIEKHDELEKKLAALGHDLSEKHLALAKKLDEGGHKAEGFRETLLALALAPDSPGARARLGYKKDGAAWRGAPARPAADSKPLDGKLAGEREALRKAASQKLLDLAKRAKAGALDDDARRVAGLALEETQDLAAARELLGHEKAGAAWTSAREARIAAAFAAALEKANPARPEKPDADDAAFASALGLASAGPATGGLVTTGHASVHTSAGAKEEKPEALARVVEAAWGALRFYLGGEDGAFSLAGPRASGTPLSVGKIRAVVAAPGEYAALVDRVTSNKDAAAFFKTCQGFHDRASLPSGPAWVCVTSEAAATRGESLADLVVDVHMDATLPAGSPSPDFVLEGLRRFVAGHAAGRVDTLYAKPGSSGRRSFEGGTFADFRGTVRETLGQGLEGDLRALLGRGQNELERADSAVAYAFVDWALEKKRGELVAFLAGLKSGEAPVATFERAFQASVEDVERALRAWARQEY